MNEMEFSLREGDEFIPLMNLLQLIGVAQTGGHAKMMIDNKEIMYNGTVEMQKRKKIRKGDEVSSSDFIIKIL